MPSPYVAQIAKKIEEIHARKSADYAKEENPFLNFERAAIIASWFNDPVDKVFATFIGNKLARKAELLNGKTPKNESIADTFLDENTYSILWHAYYLSKNTSTPKYPESFIHFQCSYCGASCFAEPVKYIHKPGDSIRFFCTREHIDKWIEQNK